MHTQATIGCTVMVILTQQLPGFAVRPFECLSTDARGGAWEASHFRGTRPNSIPEDNKFFLVLLYHVGEMTGVGTLRPRPVENPQSPLD